MQNITICHSINLWTLRASSIPFSCLWKGDNSLNPTLEKSTPPYNGNPTLIFEKSQPHRQRGDSKISQPHPALRGGCTLCKCTRKFFRQGNYAPPTIRECAKFIWGPGRVYRQGGRHFFWDKKRGARTFFQKKIGGQVVFSSWKKGGT